MCWSNKCSSLSPINIVDIFKRQNKTAAESVPVAKQFCHLFFSDEMSHYWHGIRDSASIMQRMKCTWGTHWICGNSSLSFHIMYTNSTTHFHVVVIFQKFWCICYVVYKSLFFIPFSIIKNKYSYTWCISVKGKICKLYINLMPADQIWIYFWACMFTRLAQLAFYGYKNIDLLCIIIYVWLA